ncbi:MAG: hypothetical protein GX413_10500 [Acetobacter sp.]|jgi:hypothetical protein|nr:hypothetical protein [Acetobacter sp.]
MLLPRLISTFLSLLTALFAPLLLPWQFLFHLAGWSDKSAGALKTMNEQEEIHRVLFQTGSDLYATIGLMLAASLLIFTFIRKDDPFRLYYLLSCLIILLLTAGASEADTALFLIGSCIGLCCEIFALINKKYR